jgi:hypothetical protein
VGWAAEAEVAQAQCAVMEAAAVAEVEAVAELAPVAAVEEAECR